MCDKEREMELKGVSFCPRERKPCVRWIEKYFKDCLCNLNDEISFGFGIASVICWGVAEIPQIITNFKNKSGHGVSLTFLCTWVIGDAFNLVGCLLEPATLPTQFYTALLYTTTTVILVLQCLYYDYFLHWWKCRHVEANNQDRDETKPLNPRPPAAPTVASNSPVEVPIKRDFYYTSARSMAGSGTPPAQYYIKAKSVPSVLEHDSDDQSSEDEAAIPGSSYKPVSQPWNIPRSAGYYGTFLAASTNLPRTKAVMAAYATLSGRRLLQGLHGVDENAYGQWLGWLMAAIYMGGRLPQIWLNIKRGSVEGLNPLMFIFALVANATYVGSILMRTTEWGKIKANMPWLLDAIVCVLLDLFIILQYIYYKYIRQRNKHSTEERYGDYIEANKAFVS